jgi:hypothetical protein
MRFMNSSAPPRKSALTDSRASAPLSKKAESLAALHLRFEHSNSALPSNSPLLFIPKKKKTLSSRAAQHPIQKMNHQPWPTPSTSLHNPN